MTLGQAREQALRVFEEAEALRKRQREIDARDSVWDSMEEQSMNRAKVLKVSPLLLLGYVQRGVDQCYVVKNPLPDDAAIVDARVDWNGLVCFKITSATYPEVAEGMTPPYLEDVPTFEDRCPRREVIFASLAPHSLTLTRDELAALLYDADRQPGRRLTIAVKSDGTWSTT